MYPFFQPRDTFDPSVTGASFEAYWKYRKLYVPAALALVICIPVASDASDPLWLAILATGASAAALAVMLGAFALYVAHWDELQRALLLQTASVALAGSVIALAINAVIATHGWPHLSLRYVAFVPLLFFFVGLGIMRLFYR